MGNLSNFQITIVTNCHAELKISIMIPSKLVNVPTIERFYRCCHPFSKYEIYREKKIGVKHKKNLPKILLKSYC